MTWVTDRHAVCHLAKWMSRQMDRIKNGFQPRLIPSLQLEMNLHNNFLGQITAISRGSWNNFGITRVIGILTSQSMTAKKMKCSNNWGAKRIGILNELSGNKETAVWIVSFFFCGATWWLYQEHIKKWWDKQLITDWQAVSDYYKFCQNCLTVIDFVLYNHSKWKSFYVNSNRDAYV